MFVNAPAVLGVRTGGYIGVPETLGEGLMRRMRWLVVLAAVVAATAGGLRAQRFRRVRLTWQRDMPRAIKQAHAKDVPLLLFVRDTFGEKFIDHAENARNWDEASLRRQLRRSQARWRWQRFEQDLFTNREFAQTVQPFVRVRLETGYRRLDEKTRKFLLSLNLLTDIDLAWRRRLIDDPWKETSTGLDPLGQNIYDYHLNTTLDELLARETTALAVVAGDGQLLFRFPAGPPGFEPPLKVLLGELGQVLAPYRDLAKGRHDLEKGRVDVAVAVFTGLVEAREAVPAEVSKAARGELDALLARAKASLQAVDKALAANDFERASRSLAEMQSRGLHLVNPTVAARVADLQEQLADHALELYRQAQEHLDQGKLTEAFDLLNRVARYFGGTEAGSLAKSKLEELAKDPETAEELRQARRREEAKQLLASAQQAEQGDDLVKAYGFYKRLSGDYADLPEGAHVAQKVSAWEADPEFMAQVAARRAQGEAAKLMNLGDNFFVNKLYSQAIPYYRKVIDTYPDSPAAHEAQTKMEEARRLIEAQLKKPDEPAPPAEGGP